MTEQHQHPKLRKVGEGYEQRPLNELSKFDIDRKKEMWAVYNARRGKGNILPDYLRKMKYYDDNGQIIEEDSIFEFNDLTVIGKT